MRFLDKVVIVTGGASGIGQATAQLFASEGAAVVVADLNDPSSTVQAIEAAGGKAKGLQGSVASEDFLQSMIDTAVNSYGQLDVLINNAGIGLPPAPIEDADPEGWRSVFEVNVHAGFMATKLALPHLRKTRGNVLFTSSVAGLSGQSNATCYASTKAAIINMAKSIALDHAPEGIRVNVVCPGATDTPIMDQVPVPREIFASRLPLKAMVQPEEIAQGFAYLASEHARSITGQVLTIDGGYTAGDFSMIPSAFDKHN